MTTAPDPRIDLSDVRPEHEPYLRAYFQAALEGRAFRSCKVRFPDPVEPGVRFEIVFDDGSKSRALGVSDEVAFGDDRSDRVVYDDDTGARRTVLGFAPDGVLSRLVDEAFSQPRTS